MTWANRSSSQSTREFYAEILDDADKGHQVIDVASVGINGEVYIALATPEGVRAYVAFQKWNRFYYENYNYRLHSETEWHLDQSWRCPKRILDVLSPVELLYPDDKQREQAAKWRQRSYDELAKKKARPKVSKGDTIQFDYELYFRKSKEKHDTFVWLYGSHFRLPTQEGHARYILPNWRDRNWKIIAHAEKENA
jgi:hypothetical protein